MHRPKSAKMLHVPTVFYNILYLLKYQIVPNQLYYNKKIMTKSQEKTLEVSLITFYFILKILKSFYYVKKLKRQKIRHTQVFFITFKHSCSWLI
jgi:hypothetical protein